MNLSCNGTKHTKRCVLAKSPHEIEKWMRTEIIAFVAFTKPARGEHRKAQGSDSQTIAVFFEVRNVNKSDSVYIQDVSSVRSTDKAVKIGLDTVNVAQAKL